MGWEGESGDRQEWGGRGEGQRVGIDRSGVGDEERGGIYRSVVGGGESGDGLKEWGGRGRMGIDRRGSGLERE